jgi:hypothetical protein
LSGRLIFLSSLASTTFSTAHQAVFNYAEGRHANSLGATGNRTPYYQENQPTTYWELIDNGFCAFPSSVTTQLHETIQHFTIQVSFMVAGQGLGG